MFRPTIFRDACLAPLVLLALLLSPGSVQAEGFDLAEASESITVEELKAHVGTLADDSLEGREAGTRGGRAAGNYLLDAFRDMGLETAGDEGGYVQGFGGGYRNLLGVIRGGHPELRDRYVVLGAHYDHVGYGNAGNSFGPLGAIHNGADDNASGTSGLLEVAEALSKLDPPPARSILFALWDAEEKGLLGSEHWISRPTIPLEQIDFMLNIDMIGRMTRQRLEVYGTRTSVGLRRWVCGLNEERFNLAFNWDIIDDSDHYPFYSAGIPILMYHTGLHENYHRPSDDSDLVKYVELRDISRLTMRTMVSAADRPGEWRFRDRSRSENESARREFEQRLDEMPPSRLGITMGDTAERPSSGVPVDEVERGSPASASGLRAGDRILAVNGIPTHDKVALRLQILRSPARANLSVERDGEAAAFDIAVELRGAPTRVGLTWRPDDADPSCAMVIDVVSGSPAYWAGIRPGMRLFAINGEPFEGTEGLVGRLNQLTGVVTLQAESKGVVHEIEVDIGDPL